MFLKVKFFLNRLGKLVPLLSLISLGYFWNRKATEPEKPTPVQSPTPRLSDRGQVLRRGNQYLSFINPYHTSLVEQNEVTRDLFEGLTTYNLTRQAIGSMASHWESDQTRKVWTFYLKPDARWSNGSPVTAHDFVTSWRHLCTKKNIGPDARNVVKNLLTTSFPLVNGWACYEGNKPPEELGVEAINDRMLRVRFTAPQAEKPLLERLTSTQLLPIPPQCLEILEPTRGTRDLSRCISNGPFRIVEFKPKDRVVLQKNPHYWDAKHVKLDEVIYLYCEHDEAQVGAWVDGKLDLMSMGQNIRMEGEMLPYLKQQKWIHANISNHFLLNLRDPDLSKEEVRLALNLLMERHNWAKECFPICAAPRATYGVLESHLSAVNTRYDWINLPRSERVQRAQALLEKAGYTARHPLSLTVQFTWDTSDFLIAVTRDWNLPNLKVECARRDEDEIWGRILAQKDYQVLLVSAGFSAWSPIPFFRQFSSRGNDPTGYNSAYYDDLLEQLQGAVDSEEFQRLCVELEKMLLEDMPVLPWVYACYPWVMRDYVVDPPLGSGIMPTGTLCSKHLSIKE